MVKKPSHPAVTALRTWAFVALSDISTTGKASFVATRMLSRSPSPSSHSEIATSMTAMSTVTFGLRSSSTAELLSLHSYTVSWNCLRMAEVEGTPTLSGSTTIKVVFRGSNCFTFLLLAIDAAFGIEPSASAPPLRLGIAGAQSARWVALGLARRKILGDFCECHQRMRYICGIRANSSRVFLFVVGKNFFTTFVFKSGQEVQFAFAAAATLSTLTISPSSTSSASSASPVRIFFSSFLIPYLSSAALEKWYAEAWTQSGLTT